MNDGILRGLWFITECPYCHNPMATNKVVIHGSVLKPLAPKFYDCEHCDNGYFVQLKELKCDLDGV